MDEFALIREYFGPLSATGDGVVLGIGDDAAILSPRSGCDLVVTSDTLIRGRHFPDDCAPYDVGWKALAVNLSDLAAMGARPRWYTLALSIDVAAPDWLAAFVAGLRAVGDPCGIRLVGGDTTRGSLSITITAFGEVDAGTALRRDGARAGDTVCVTGTLGDAALALQELASASRADPCGGALQQRLARPLPRVAAGAALRGLAHAAIDLSDGLCGDLMHVLRASGVGARIDLDSLPMSAAFKSRVPPGQRHRLQACGGDDYELCLCLPPERMAEAAGAIDVGLTPVGVITDTGRLELRDATGAPVALEMTAYRHFS